MASLGTFYGIGVGPGDPELLTLKAIKILQKVPHVFAASSSKNDYSVALQAVRNYLSPGVQVYSLPFPMTYDQEKLEKAWHDNCRSILSLLLKGEDVAFITIGDPLIYSTYIYLLRKIRSLCPEVSVQTIPGITSFQAAASVCNIPLVEGEESMAVVSGAQGVSHLEKTLESCDTVVMLKVYRQMPEIIETLEKRSLSSSICYVSRCGFYDQEVVQALEELKNRTPHYLSLMIVKKKGLF
ncbi:MAG: precorrin-2 C(20)-methyltransferase [Syntrophobacterales bacterium]|nr:precorrin-2 C(20)-methyltransferase [Syntrophobacterales bacterium]